MAVHQQSLAHEVHNFVKNAHRLRGVLSETESMFKDINTCGNFDQDDTSCLGHCNTFVPIINLQDLEELKELHEAEPELPVFFVRVPPPLPLDLTDGPSRVNGVGPTNEYRNSNSKRNSKRNSAEYKIGLNLFQQLCDIGFLSMLPTSTEQVLQTLSSSTSSGSGEHVIMESELLENFDQFTPSLVQYTQRVLRQMLVAVAGVMNQIHGRCLKMIIMTAFDMQRDMMVTPRRLEFAREKECELYNSLMDIAMKKQDEIKTIIAETVQDMKEKLVAKAAEYDFIGVDISDSAEIRTARDLKICTGQVEELLLGALNNAIAGKLVESVDILRDSYT
ncbi:dual serine/threonine and tyrosine protein kinase-like, partial [Lingula anatina]|uniref:Dual serine/threonine and tyrosine protein kinase-like n=1 Tax=Lingula anatina TaxID=7574 RepID=A0A1S3IBF2_LINAN